MEYILKSFLATFLHLFESVFEDKLYLIVFDKFIQCLIIPESQVTNKNSLERLPTFRA